MIFKAQLYRLKVGKILEVLLGEVIFLGRNLMNITIFFAEAYCVVANM